MNTNSGNEINVELLGPRTSANAEEAFDFVGGVLEASTEYSLVATDLDGVILLWNEGACRLYGYEPAEVIGQPKSLLHTEEDVLRGLPQAMMDQALEQGKWEGRVERRRKDASNFIVRVMLTPRRDRWVNYGLTTRSLRRYLQMARFRFSRCLSASRLHERCGFVTRWQ